MNFSVGSLIEIQASKGLLIQPVKHIHFSPTINAHTSSKHDFIPLS